MNNPYMRLYFDSSGYSNQGHQLLINVSKHYYVLNNGRIKYQSKSLGYNLKNYNKSEKELLVYYLMKDVFSGSFHLTVTTTRAMIPVEYFFYLAWEEDKYKNLWGMPETLIVPKSYDLPDTLLEGLYELGINVDYPLDGFNSGIKTISDVDREVSKAMWRLEKENIEPSTKNLIALGKAIEIGMTLHNHEVWKERLRKVRQVPPWETFLKYFKEPYFIPGNQLTKDKGKRTVIELEDTENNWLLKMAGKNKKSLNRLQVECVKKKESVEYTICYSSNPQNAIAVINIYDNGNTSLKNNSPLTISVDFKKRILTIDASDAK